MDSSVSVTFRWTCKGVTDGMVQVLVLSRAVLGSTTVTVGNPE